MNMKKTILLHAVILLSSVFLFQACKKKEDVKKAVISVKGSDTMVNLAQKWAEVFMNQNANVSVQVTGGGSGTGVAALLNGTTDIAASSRELKSKEKEQASAKNIQYEEFKVALDGIAVIVHPENPLNELTMDQVRDIFSGKIKDYSEVKTAGGKITLYGRENSSGTYEFFREHVLGKDKHGNEIDYATNTQVLQGTAALAEAVARDKKAIAYGGVGYFAMRTDVKILGIKKDADSPAIYPAKEGKVNFEDIWSGAYSISRYLYMFTSAKPVGAIEQYMNFVLSPEGQKIVETMEYIPLPR
jgi:phosphate transport system substrate-binding protein